MATHSFNTLMRRLSLAGFNKQLVKTALIPDWWEEPFSKDSSLLPEIELRVSRFLGLPLSTVRNPEQELNIPDHGSAQLRRVRDINRDRMGPAIHTAVQVGAAVVRNLRNNGNVKIPPSDAHAFRQVLKLNGDGPVQLGSILTEAWSSGIPVIQLDTLPSPKFQGLAIFVDEHPIICLGHRHDEPGRVTFIVAHEIGHIVTGDCSPNAPVLHEIEGGYDGSEMERAADQFAARMLLGDPDIALPVGLDADPKGIAQAAFELESTTGAEASTIIYEWAARTLDYATAAMAVKALYRSSGAMRQVRMSFDEYVDLATAPASDREILRCVYGEPDPPTVAF